MPVSMNVCTIVAKNYVAFARVLAASLREHHPDSTLTVLMLDDYEGFVDPTEEQFELLTTGEITDLPFAEMADRYTILELSTAVKPWLLKHLLSREGADHAVYLDPDIQVVGPMDHIREAAVEHQVVLTPHMLSPIPRDGMFPREQSILISGAYNLGFIALGAEATAIDLLDWWSERLESDCSVDVANGLFVDQKWIDLVPGMWPSTHILHDPGCNVAYWNYHERTLSAGEAGQVLVNGVPATFLHWSGYDPATPQQLSKYQTRIGPESRPDVREASDAYGRALLEAGHAESTRWPFTIRELGIGPAAQDDVPGVNVVGYLMSEHGLGETARQFIEALEAAGVDVTPVPIPGGVSREEFPFEHPQMNGPVQPVTLLCVNADMLPAVAESLDEPLLDKTVTIGQWWWETERFPTRFRPALDVVDEVWAGSQFVADAITPVSPKPVVAFPHPLAPPVDVRPDRERLGLPDGFLFLFMFDFNSISVRKNPDGLVEAYTRAFPEPQEDVHLILKAMNGHRHPDHRDALLALAGGRPDVVLIDKTLDAHDRDALLASCDCYVSLHRSEGFGQTLAEAMMLGKPVIATDYGGSAEFVSSLTGFPVRFSRTRVGPGSAPYDADDEWAEPDLDHAAELMRLVATDPQAAAEQGARGREFVSNHHSHMAVGVAIADRLRRLGARSIPSRAIVSREEKHLPDALRARKETLGLIKRDSTWATSRWRRLVQRFSNTITRREAHLRRENDEALWWSIEASSVVQSERHDELLRAHGVLTEAVDTELRHLREEVRALNRKLSDRD